MTTRAPAAPSGAAIGLISAVGALGGLLVNLAFRQSFAGAGSPV